MCPSPLRATANAGDPWPLGQVGHELQLPAAEVNLTALPPSASSWALRETPRHLALRHVEGVLPEAGGLERNVALLLPGDPVTPTVTVFTPRHTAPSALPFPSQACSQSSFRPQVTLNSAGP